MSIDVFDGVASAVVGDVAVFVWNRPASEARHAYTIQIMEELAARSPKGFVGVYIIAASASPPDAKLRAQIMTNFKAIGSRMRRLIAVPIGDSMWAGVVRTLARGMFALAGLGDRIEVARGVMDCAARIDALAGPDTPPGARFAQTTREMFKKLDMPVPDELAMRHHA